jgi:ElaB/YqjD/DUF883 family membrane-anchored ribosome-binding protein
MGETMHVDGVGGVAEVAPRLVQKAKAADERVVALVRERPLAALCVALAAGYLVGRMISRLG